MLQGVCCLYSGIGPEIVDAVIKVLDALGAPFEWAWQQGGIDPPSTQ